MDQFYNVFIVLLCLSWS